MGGVGGRGAAVRGALAVAAAVVLGSASAPGTAAAAPPDPDGGARWCAAAPPYYAFPLVTTARVPGTAQASGDVRVGFPDSPFGVVLADDGSYRLELEVELRRLPAPAAGRYVAWVTTTQVDRVVRLGEVDDGRVQGRVDWNKFLVVITLEPEGAAPGDAWSGPVVLRGMSRSGMMHTMAGHGPFQQENCARYGYDG